MLRSPKNSVLHLAPPSHVDVFVEHYDQLKKWALRFTEHDQEAAEDLLHDTFINLTLSKPDLTSIQNLEGYLFIVMRNLHLSQVRRATRLPVRSFSVVEYDTAEMPFWASDPREHLRMRDELAAVCRIACIRKESSKGGSLLILRFFHGYYPEEIAEIMRTTRTAVNSKLKKVRIETRIFIEEPDRLRMIEDKMIPAISLNTTYGGDDLRLQLRSYIFKTCQGDCVSDEVFNDLYVEKKAEYPDHKTLAHIVSCEACIERVNSLLGLAPLASRYPVDMVGNDPGSKNGPGEGGGSGAGGAGGTKPMLDSYINRRDAHYNHEPRELCVSVNGQFQSLQRVISGKGEMLLSIDTNETLGFVEVFSELGVRLLTLHVEPLPGGEANQSAHIELSYGRTLAASLDFSGRVPTLRVNYDDPSLVEAEALEAELSVPPAMVTGKVTDHVPFAETLAAKPSFVDSVRAWFDPMKIAVASTILIGLLAAIWFVSQPEPTGPLGARAVLKKARDAEFALAPTAEKVLHRNYQVEEWTNGELRSRKRIDEWQRLMVTARRTYDDQGQMVAGKWLLESGHSKVFEKGEKLRLVYKGQQDAEPQRTFEPTANAFANLIDRHGVTQKVAIEQTDANYRFNFEDRKGETEQAGLNERLIAANLVLEKNGLMVISQTLVLQIGGETREYRFSDIRVEQKPVTEVSPLIFEPEAELAKGATTVSKPLAIELPAVPLAIASGEVPRAPNAATLDTEVEIFRALDSVNALSGDQISITRTTTGQLKVTGIVDTNQRKQEILNAIGNLRSAQGVTIDVQTAQEAASRQAPSGEVNPIELDAARTESDRRLPVEDELRAYFERRGAAGDALNSQVNAYASAVLNRSDSLRRNALSLKRLAERFSPAELERLESAKRDQWKALLRSKAAAVASDARSLSSQLSAVGLGVGGDGAGGASIKDANDAAEAAQRLFGLGVECDTQVRQSFSISRGGVASVKTVQFWRNLRQMSALAAELQRF